MSPQEKVPAFSQSRRGYDPSEVDQYIGMLQRRIAELEERLEGGAGGVPERLAQILALANDEAGEIRARAKERADEIVAVAALEAQATADDAAQRSVDAERQLRELTATREHLLESLAGLRDHIDRAIEYHREGSDGAEPGDVTQRLESPPTAETEVVTTASVEEEA